jgi:hypothetical protein
VKNYLAILGGANRAAPVALAVIAGLVAIWLAMLVLGAGAGDRFILFNLYAGQRHWLELIGLGLSRLQASLLVGVGPAVGNVHRADARVGAKGGYRAAAAG